MAIPDYQSLMLPLLEAANHGREMSMLELREQLAQKLGLTEEEKKELLPSGRQAIFSNRVAWAKIYLQKAGLLESTKRAHFVITKRGMDVLESGPDQIDNAYLEQYQEFLEFRSRGGKKAASTKQEQEETQATPEEQLQEAYQKIRADLETDLIKLIKKASPQFFERLVLDLLINMGYGGSRQDAAQALGRSGDEGIDGVIAEDRLGLDVIYLQAKRWDGNAVGRPEIQRFVGALHGKRARKGVFVTTERFTKEAVEYVKHIDPRVVLIDGHRLAQLMIDYDLGVSTAEVFEIKTPDLDYFAED